MSKIMEERIKEAAAQASFERALNDIKNVMKNTDSSAEKAMRILDIPESDFSLYLSKL